MKTSDFYYDLPPELIAQTPIEPRDSSKLLVFDRKRGVIEHKKFFNITDYLKNGDVLVVNNTRVIPARLYGEREGGGAKVEILLLKRRALDEFEILIKPGKRFPKGSRLCFADELKAEIIEVLDDGNRICRFEYSGVFEDILHRIGEMPLPHYIHGLLKDKERYQTVYNKIDGSSAAPTAGLHFTLELLEKLKQKGVEKCEVTLDVGLGTFRPVKSEIVEQHIMHSEHFSIDEKTAAIINKAKAEGRRVIAVGTTSVRVLESAAIGKGVIAAKSGETDIFIYPPYEFKITDALITNFHLPSSTLLMLVSAFMGKENAMQAYKSAIDNKYRFFSFGDSTLIL